MKKLIYGFLICGAVFLTSQAYAFSYTYHVDFTGPDFNAETWASVFDGTWTHENAGDPLNGNSTGVSEVAAAHYDPLPYIDTTGIMLSTVLTPHAGGSAGLFFGVSPMSGAPASPGGDDFNRITVGVEERTDNTGASVMALYIDNNNSDVYNDPFLLGNVTLGMKLQLMVRVGEDDLLSWMLWDMDNLSEAPLASDSGISVAALTGLAGVFSDEGASDFYSFSVDGNAVPAPAAMVLLASGMLGLAGIRRRHR